MLEALPAQAGSTLSHFSGRCRLQELPFERTQSPSRFWNLFTIQHTSYPSCELLSQNTLNWSMKHDFSLPTPCKTFSLLSLSHITDVAANHSHFWQTLSSKLYIKIQRVKPRYILLEQTVMSAHRFMTSEAGQAFSIIESSFRLFWQSISL